MPRFKFFFLPLLAVFISLWFGSTRAETSFLGLNVQATSPKISAALGLENNYGVLIRDVAAEGPAAAAGFLRGDLIYEFDQKKIENFAMLLEAVGEAKPGKKISVVVIRQSQKIVLQLIPSYWPESWRFKKEEFASLPELGLSLASLSEKVRKNFDIRWGATGIIISLVDEKLASKIALQRGDIVVQINQNNVWKPGQFSAAFNKAKTLGRSHMLLLVDRAGSYRFMLVPLDLE